MKRKSLILFTFIVSIFILASCSISNITFIKEQYSFKNYSSEFNNESKKIDTYFKGNNKYVAYVDIKQYLSALDGIYNYENIEFIDDKENNKYIIKYNEFENVFDYKNQIIEYDSFDFLRELEETDYSYCLQFSSEYNDTEAHKVKLDLSKYDINLYYREDKLLIEFDLLNLLLCSDGLYLVLFNGSGYFGDFYHLSYELQNDAYTYDLATTIIPKEIKIQDGKYLSLLMENYYGLYDYKDLSNDNSTKNIRNTLKNTSYKNYAQVVYDYFNSLDDGHTGMYTYPLYDGGYIRYSKYGETVNKLYDVNDELEEAKDAAGINDNELNIVGDTAFISFNSFNTEPNIDLDNIDLNADYEDTFLFSYVCLMKLRNNPNIKNVVFDISTNGGGNVGALMRLCGLLTNEDILFNEESFNMSLEEETKIKVDANIDGSFDDLDAFTEFNYYILTSEASFSCANAFPTMAVTQGFAKVNGQKSSGGMCSVMVYVLPSGILFQASSPQGSYGYLNGEKYYFEGGAPVDIEIPYDKFYDFQYIANLINE